MSKNLSFNVSSVPRDWLIIPCGVFFKEKSIKNTEGEMNLSVYRDYGVIPKDSRDDNHNRVSEDTSNYKLVEPGDFVLNKMKGWSGSLGVSDYRGIVSPSYTVLEPVREIHNKYFHYLLRSETYRQMYESLSYGVRIGQWELRYHDFKQIPSLYPPIDEQKLISRYLDKKTNQIDSLIEKIHKKIELLKEQRTSLINHYVTKGLDPNVEMKDSGIEWIGEIPKDWDVQRISTLYSQTSVRGFSEEQNLSVFRDHGVVRRDDYENKNVLSDDLSNYKLVNQGDLVLNKMKTWMGSLGVSEYRGIVSPAYYVLRPNFEFFSGYLHYLLRSKIYIDQYASVSKGVRPGQWDLSYDEFKSLKVILPPIDEQKETYNRLTKELQFNSQLSNLESKKIEFLKEYRQSLISSIVTGQIRVTEDTI
jgi:type I restriction enzyme S subunit